jgi:hypothetical protein
MNGYVLVEDLMDKLYTSCKQTEAGEKLASDVTRAISEEIHPTSVLTMIETALENYRQALSTDKPNLAGLGRFSEGTLS